MKISKKEKERIAINKALKLKREEDDRKKLEAQFPLLFSHKMILKNKEDRMAPSIRKSLLYIAENPELLEENSENLENNATVRKKATVPKTKRSSMESMTVLSGKQKSRPMGRQSAQAKLSKFGSEGPFKVPTAPDTPLQNDQLPQPVKKSDDVLLSLQKFIDELRAQESSASNADLPPSPATTPLEPTPEQPEETRQEGDLLQLFDSSTSYKFPERSPMFIRNVVPFYDATVVEVTEATMELAQEFDDTSDSGCCSKDAINSTLVEEEQIQVEAFESGAIDEAASCLDQTQETPAAATDTSAHSLILIDENMLVAPEIKEIQSTPDLSPVVAEVEVDEVHLEDQLDKTDEGIPKEAVPVEVTVETTAEEFELTNHLLDDNLGFLECPPEPLHESAEEVLMEGDPKIEESQDQLNAMLDTYRVAETLQSSDDTFLFNKEVQVDETAPSLYTRLSACLSQPIVSSDTTSDKTSVAIPVSTTVTKYSVQQNHVLYSVQIEVKQSSLPQLIPSLPGGGKKDRNDLYLRIQGMRRYSSFLNLYEALCRAAELSNEEMLAIGCSTSFDIPQLTAKQTLPLFCARWRNQSYLESRQQDLNQWLCEAISLPGKWMQLSLTEQEPHSHEASTPNRRNMSIMYHNICTRTAERCRESLLHFLLGHNFTETAVMPSKMLVSFDETTEDLTEGTCWVTSFSQ